MPIDLGCPDCGARYRVNDQMAGKKVRCKKCGGVVAIPSATPTDDILGFKEEEPVVTAAPVVKSSPRRPAPVKSKPAARPAPVEDDSPYAALEEAAQQVVDEPVVIPQVTAPAPATRFQMPRPLGYATPRRQTELQPPEWVDRWSPIFIGVLVTGGLINTILVIIVYAAKNGEMPPALSIGVLIGSWLISVAVACGVVAPLLLLGIWLSGKMMNFQLGDGAYKKTLAITGVPSTFGLVTMILLTILGLIGIPGPVALGLIVTALVGGLFVMVRLLKDAFLLTWGQTAVAAVMAILIAFVVPFLVLLLIAMVIGGSIAALTKMGTGATPPAPARPPMVQPASPRTTPTTPPPTSFQRPTRAPRAVPSRPTPPPEAPTPKNEFEVKPLKEQ